jgi:very-short-patch-repair endonuclease
MNESIAKARALRRATTLVEAKVWRWLRDRRFRHNKFRRQHPIGPFVADFYCERLRLVIELDGQHHFDDEEQVLYDKKRTAYLEKHGMTVLRISNEDVRERAIFVADRIDAAIAAISLRRFSP